MITIPAEQLRHPCIAILIPESLGLVGEETPRLIIELLIEPAGRKRFVPQVRTTDRGAVNGEMNPWLRESTNDLMLDVVERQLTIGVLEHHNVPRPLEEAADVAEFRLGFSSLESHGASHIAKFMPEGMRSAGTSMHRAASQFARIAQEGEVLPAYQKLKDITAACVTCHAAYRVQ